MSKLNGKSLVSRLDFGYGQVVTVETLRLESDVDTIARHREQIDEICALRGVAPVYPATLDVSRLH